MGSHLGAFVGMTRRGPHLEQAWRCWVLISKCLHLFLWRFIPTKTWLSETRLRLSLSSFFVEGIHSVSASAPAYVGAHIHVHTRPVPVDICTHTPTPGMSVYASVPISICTSVPIFEFILDQGFSVLLLLIFGAG